MCRGVRRMTLSYKGLSRTVDMPGWYCADDDTGYDGILDDEDLNVSDEALFSMRRELGEDK